MENEKEMREGERMTRCRKHVFFSWHNTFTLKTKSLWDFNILETKNY